MIKQNIPLQNTEWVTETISTRQSWEAKHSADIGGFLDLCDVINQFQEAQLLSREVHGFEHWGYNCNNDSREKNIQMYPKSFPSWWWGLKGREKVIFRPVSPTAQPLWTVWLTEHISRNSCHVSLTDSHCRWAPGYSGSILGRPQAVKACWCHCKKISVTLENTGKQTIKSKHIFLLLWFTLPVFPLLHSHCLFSVLPS